MTGEWRNKVEPDSGADRLSSWLLVYALGYAVFHILPPYLGWEMRDRLTTGDVFDLLTPFVMIFLVYRVFRVLTRTAANARGIAGPSVLLVLILGGISFVEGHGMHLSANAIARHLTSQKGSSLYALDYFFDEFLGHILWDSGVVLLSIGLIGMGFNLNEKNVSRPRVFLTLPAALFYGFTYFANGVEGQTVIFTFPVAIAIPALILWYARRRRLRVRRNPVLCLFFLGYLLAFCLFVFWGIWKRGFPQFSELNWL